MEVCVDIDEVLLMGTEAFCTTCSACAVVFEEEEVILLLAEEEADASFFFDSIQFFKHCWLDLDTAARFGPGLTVTPNSSVDFLLVFEFLGRPLADDILILLL